MWFLGGAVLLFDDVAVYHFGVAAVIGHDFECLRHADTGMVQDEVPRTQRKIQGRLYFQRGKQTKERIEIVITSKRNFYYT